MKKTITIVVTIPFLIIGLVWMANQYLAKLQSQSNGRYETRLEPAKISPFGECSFQYKLAKWQIPFFPVLTVNSNFVNLKDGLLPKQFTANGKGFKLLDNLTTNKTNVNGFLYKNSRVIFSTSDCADPRTNGVIYKYYTPLKIDFKAIGITIALVLLGYYFALKRVIDPLVLLVINHVSPIIRLVAKKTKAWAAKVFFIIIAFITVTFVAAWVYLFFTKVGNKMVTPAEVIQFILAIKLLPILSSLYLTLIETINGFSFWSKYSFFIGSMIGFFALIYGKKYIISSIFLIVGLVWVIFFDNVTAWMNTLGIDSFMESKNVYFADSLFWFSTIWPAIKPTLSFGMIIQIVLVFAATFGFYLIVKRWKEKSKYIYIGVIASIIVVTYANSITLTFKTQMKDFIESSKIFLKVNDNFNNTAPTVKLNDNKITIIAYIGEATSAMNMGVYGYFRDTTPNLTKFAKTNSGLIIINNVFSTHTHTSPSLLEGFSFGYNQSNEIIYNQKRLSVIDVLIKNNVDALLFTNTEKYGTYNLAESIVLSKAKSVFSLETKLTGNFSLERQRPPDYEFFEPHLINELATDSAKSKRIILLHSTAGHGPYYDHIDPEFRNAIDSFFKNRPGLAIYGAANNLISDKHSVDEYDSAIRYVDYAVSRTIEFVNKSKKPIIFIYFSDHGEAPYLGRGHDSARYVHEMSRIPFIIYFNDAARKTHQALFDKYKALSRQKNISTLAQLSSTLLDLVGGDLAQLSKNGVFVPTVIGQNYAAYSPDSLNYTQPENATTEVRSTDSLNSLSHGIMEKISKDVSSNLFKLNYENPKPYSNICFHRADSLGSIVRGAFLSNCIETDLTVETDGTLSIRHPPAEATGITLADVFAITQKLNNSLWIDGKNIHTPKSCNFLLDFLKKHVTNNRKILVEFSNNLDINNKDLRQCITAIKAKGLYTGYYPDTEIVGKCLAEITNGENYTTATNCVAFEERIKAIAKSNLFSEMSLYYPFRAVYALSTAAKRFSWAPWDVTVDDFKAIKPGQYRFIIPLGRDPNYL